MYVTMHTRFTNAPLSQQQTVGHRFFKDQNTDIVVNMLQLMQVKAPLLLTKHEKPVGLEYMYIQCTYNVHVQHAMVVHVHVHCTRATSVHIQYVHVHVHVYTQVTHPLYKYNVQMYMAQMYNVIYMYIVPLSSS